MLPKGSETLIFPLRPRRMPTTESPESRRYERRLGCLGTHAPTIWELAQITVAKMGQNMSRDAYSNVNRALWGRYTR